MNKIAVVSCGIGLNSIQLYEPIFKNADYYFFTDSNVSSSFWNIRKLYSESLDSKYSNRRCGKIPKILTHYLLPQYDYYIWHDYTHELNCDPELMVSKFLNNYDIAFFKHFERTSWDTELEVVKQSNLDHDFLLDNQKLVYQQMNIEKDKNFYECTCFIRRNNDIANKTFSFWYEHINQFSSRDQISLPAAIQKHNPKINVMDGVCQMYHGGNNYIVQIRHSLRYLGLVK